MIWGNTESHVTSGYWACSFTMGGSISVGAQSILGVQDIFARKHMHEILTKCPNFTWLLPKNFFPHFWGGNCPLPPSPTAIMGGSTLYLSSRVREEIGRQTHFGAVWGKIGIKCMPLFECVCVVTVVNKRKAKFLADCLKSWNSLCRLFIHVAQNELKNLENY